jgi:hypothetical protein
LHRHPVGDEAVVAAMGRNFLITFFVHGGYAFNQFLNQPPRSKLSRYEMNVIISQQATGN